MDPIAGQSAWRSAVETQRAELGPSGRGTIARDGQVPDRTRQAGDLVVRPILRLVSALCRALAAEGIAYCHWKSNAALARSGSGENDLDLLVAPRDAPRLCGLLATLGFKQVPGSPRQQVPGIQSYYGLDGDSGRLVHIHLHTRLVLGHDATKNYHLPIERPYLQSATLQGLFRVPAMEFEWVVFVIRMVLKHATWDAMLTGHGALSASEQKELAYLEAQVERGRVYGILSRHLPVVDAALFDECVRTLRPGCPFRSRANAAQRLHRRLRAYARQPQAMDVYLKLRHRLVWGVKGRVLHRTTGNPAPGGGLVVAIVGGDGAGKSTAVHELQAWLSEAFVVRKFHLGKPHWSPLTAAVRGALKLGRSLGLYPFSRAPEPYTQGAFAPLFPGYPTLVRAVCTARDRYLTYERVRRLAAHGGIALCDRYPLPGVLAMDGPWIERMMAEGPQNAFVRSLARLEKHYYAAIMPPHLLAVLRVHPAIAVRRRTEEDANAVRARCRMVWQCDWRPAGAHIVDAAQPRERVLSELKALIWSEM